MACVVTGKRRDVWGVVVAVAALHACSRLAIGRGGDTGSGRMGLWGRDGQIQSAKIKKNEEKQW